MNKCISLMISVGIAITLSYSATSVYAQTSTTPSAQTAAPVSTMLDKHALITELLKLLNVDRMAETMQKNMYAAMEKSVTATMQADPDIASLTAHDQKLAITEANRTMQRVQELYAKQIDTKAMMKNLTYHLYDKYYSVDEIRDLIAFYKSPTGQKTVSLMPQITSDTVQIYSQTAMPRLQAIMKQVLTEENQRLRKLGNSSERNEVNPHDID